MENLPSVGVMDSFYELEVADSISPKSGCEIHRELFEALELRPKLDPLNIIDDVQESHTSACIIHRLLRS